MTTSSGPTEPAHTRGVSYLTQPSFIMQLALLKESGVRVSSVENRLKVLKLKHPRSGNACLCLHDDEDLELQELLKFSEPNRSWFVNDLAISDGSLILAAPVDPLFFILTYLENGKHFSSLEDILVDSDFPEVRFLKAYTMKYDISCICDSKDFSGDKVYKYNREKTLEWLRFKLHRLKNGLKPESVSLDLCENGSHAANFKDPKQEAQSETCLLEYAFGMMSDYISVKLAEELRSFIGLPETIPIKQGKIDSDNLEPKAKKLKTGSQSLDEPVEDYSSGPKKAKVDVKNKKLTVTQRKLMKVDKTGMKAISSFFTKK